MSHKKTERNEEIVRLHVEGTTFTEIGKRYGLSRNRVCEIYHATHIPGDNRYLPTTNKEDTMDTIPA